MGDVEKDEGSGGVIADVTAKALELIAAGDWHPNVAEVVIDDLKFGWAVRAIREARNAAARKLDGSARTTLHAALEHFLSPDVSAAIERIGVEGFRAVLVELVDVASAPHMARLAWQGVPFAAFDDRRRALRDPSLFDREASAQIQADWATFADQVLGSLGPRAIAAAVPVILAAITGKPEVEKQPAAGKTEAVKVDPKKATAAIAAKKKVS